MWNQMRSEWIKLRSVRSTVVMFILSIVICAVIGGLAQIGGEGDSSLDIVFVGLYFSQIFFMVLGVQVIGQEYRFKTIRSTFAATPKRIRVMIAKLLVLIGTIGVTTLLLFGISILCAQSVLSIQGYSIDFAADENMRILFGMFFTSILFAVFGFAIGSILRQPVAGIVVSIIWVMAAEPIGTGVLSIWSIDIDKWLPFSALTQTTLPEASVSPDVLSPLVTILYVSGIFAVLVALGTALINRRDA